jgi:hypothetical protein
MLLVYPVKDRKEGYQELSRYLPAIRVDPDGSEDFQYRINRPRKSRSLDGMKLNRLMTWSVGARRGFFLHLAAGKEAIKADASQSSPAYFCRLEMDLNTEGERLELLPRASSVQLLDELFGFAREIAEMGDVP